MSATALPADALDVRFDATVPVLGIPAALDFDALREWIRIALPPQLEVIGGRTCRLALGDRELKLFDLRRLLHVLRDEFSVEVTGLYVDPRSVHRYAERELKLKLFLVDPQAPIEPDGADLAPPEGLDAADPDTDLPELDSEMLDPPEPMEARAYSGQQAEQKSDPGRRTLNLHRTIRSGAVVRFDGDVVLYGDVNPGAQIVAAGNILVLGTLKGLAHAGATGDEEAFVVALSLQATQLRVARKIATLPARQAIHPELARIVGEEITIEPYSGRAQITDRPNKETHHG